MDSSGRYPQLHNTAAYKLWSRNGRVRQRTGGDKAEIMQDACVSCWEKCIPIASGKCWLCYPCLWTHMLCFLLFPSLWGSIQHRLYIKMDNTSSLPAAIQKWSQNIPDTNASMFLDPESLITMVTGGWSLWCRRSPNDLHAQPIVSQSQLSIMVFQPVIKAS